MWLCPVVRPDEGQQQVLWSLEPGNRGEDSSRRFTSREHGSDPGVEFRSSSSNWCSFSMKPTRARPTGMTAGSQGQLLTPAIRCAALADVSHRRLPQLLARCIQEGDTVHHNVVCSVAASFAPQHVAGNPSSLASDRILFVVALVSGAFPPSLWHIGVSHLTMPQRRSSKAKPLSSSRTGTSWLMRTGPRSIS